MSLLNKPLNEAIRRAQLWGDVSIASSFCVRPVDAVKALGFADPYSLDAKYDFVLDIQGDEPLISPYHIDEVIRFHEKNKDADIILPTLKIKFPDNPNLVKVVTNKKNEVLYLSRAKIPHESKSKCKF